MDPTVNAIVLVNTNDMEVSKRSSVCIESKNKQFQNKTADGAKASTKQYKSEAHSRREETGYFKYSSQSTECGTVTST